MKQAPARSGRSMIPGKRSSFGNCRYGTGNVRCDPRPLVEPVDVSFAIESFNELVSAWIATVVQRSKSAQVLDNLTTCVADLLATGMLTINSHVRAAVDRRCSDDELLETILDRFAFLISDLLPYLEAILLVRRQL